MTKLKVLLLVIAVCIACLACEPAASSTSANLNTGSRTATNVEPPKPAPAPPAQDMLFAVEKQLWEGWKNREARPFETVLSDKYVGFASTGRIGKAETIKSLSDQKCEIKTYSFSDEQMMPVGDNVAILTFKAAQDGVCDGKPISPAVWALSVYAREGDNWKAVYYSEAPLIDPKAPPTQPSVPATAKPAPDTAKPDPQTDALLALEKRGWEAWKNKDQKALEEVLANEFVFVAGEGRADRAATIKMGTTDNKCEMKSFELTEAKSVMVSSDVSLLTFRVSSAGSCDGRTFRSTNWYGSGYQKSGDSWMSVFSMILP